MRLSALAFLLLSASLAHARLTDRCDADFGNGEVEVGWADEVTAMRFFEAIASGKRVARDTLYRLWEPRRIERSGSGFILTFEREQDTAQIAASIRADPLLASLGVVGAAEARWGFCYGVPMGVQGVTMVEYYNAKLDRFAMTPRPEVRDARAQAGSGWARTGEVWRATHQHPCHDVRPIFQFHHRASNTQYFTSDAEECGDLRRLPGWRYQGEPFGGKYPVNEQCPAQTTPVHLMSAPAPRTAYRYVARPELREQLVSSGWRAVELATCLFENPYHRR